MRQLITARPYPPEPRGSGLALGAVLTFGLASLGAGPAGRAVPGAGRLAAGAAVGLAGFLAGAGAVPGRLGLPADSGLALAAAGLVDAVDAAGFTGGKKYRNENKPTKKHNQKQRLGNQNVELRERKNGT